MISPEAFGAGTGRGDQGGDFGFDQPRISVTVEQITDLEVLTDLLETGGLTQLYQDVFAATPYFESFSNDDVREIFEKYVNQGILFVTKEGNQVVGFGAALPIDSVPEIKAILSEAELANLEGSWYMADVGVNPNNRRQGIARQLVQQRINAIPDGSLIVMRTSVDNVASQSLYYSLDFKQVEAAYQNVEQGRVDGSTETDDRLFLARMK